ncbi:MAG: hypothetical protein HEQ39_02790 [Rhizobacter sp.]
MAIGNDYSVNVAIPLLPNFAVQTADVNVNIRKLLPTGPDWGVTTAADSQSKSVDFGNGWKLNLNHNGGIVELLGPTGKGGELKGFQGAWDPHLYEIKNDGSLRHVGDIKRNYTLQPAGNSEFKITVETAQSKVDPNAWYNAKVVATNIATGQSLVVDGLNPEVAGQLTESLRNGRGKGDRDEVNRLDAGLKDGLVIRANNDSNGALKSFTVVGADGMSTEVNQTTINQADEGFDKSKDVFAQDPRERVAAEVIRSLNLKMLFTQAQPSAQTPDKGTEISAITVDNPSKVNPPSANAAIKKPVESTKLQRLKVNVNIDSELPLPNPASTSVKTKIYS